MPASVPVKRLLMRLTVKENKRKVTETKTAKILNWMEFRLGASEMTVKHVSSTPFFAMAPAVYRETL